MKIMDKQTITELEDCVSNNEGIEILRACFKDLGECEIVCISVCDCEEEP